MTDEELNETAKMMEWMMADWARASPDDSDWCAKASSAIRQLMRERDEVLKIANQCALEWEDAATLRDRIAALYAGTKHPPAPF